MIPGVLIAGIGKYWKFAVVGVVGIALVIALLVARSDANHWRGKYKTLGAQHKTFVADVKVNAAAILVKALNRVKADYAARNHVTQEVSNAYQADLASLRIRYDRLRAQRTGGRPAGQTATVPQVPSTTLGYHVCTGNPGLWCISPEVATNLAQHADENTLQLEKAQTWISQQGSVTVPTE